MKIDEFSDKDIDFLLKQFWLMRLETMLIGNFIFFMSVAFIFLYFTWEFSIKVTFITGFSFTVVKTGFDIHQLWQRVKQIGK